MSKEFSANIHDPNHTVEEYDIYFNGDILSGNGEHEFSANVHDPNHTAEEYDIYFNGELIESGGGGGSSDMHGWTDGVPYTDLTIVKNEYCQASSGRFLPYEGWDRTDYVPCNGASSITFPPLNQHDSGAVSSNGFFDENHIFITGSLVLSRTESTTVTVPSNAYYFVISCESEPLETCINTGVIPHA